MANRHRCPDEETLAAYFDGLLAPEAAERGWTALYEQSLAGCMHGAGCAAGATCSVGTRQTFVSVVHGSVVPVWGTLEGALRPLAQHSRRIYR